ncbi:MULTISPECIES: PilZ domain-containing protein [Sphingomonadaceae]|uniref:PilZ domain-containing protein n=1 Tax=Sphingomonadaceae TaxID=41297 RepID=UPI00115ACFF6|nr:MULTISPECIES: PilZ domain-containing protein [Sphingomonadaceae]QDK31582.1 PilZ domain-containing protein [Sphingomonas sp. IC081]QSR16140.1 pilus assembly protein PilZ [Novosphingobium sp. KA1]
MARSSSPRQASRRAVSLTAQCRTQSGLRDRGEISDISASGCCVRVSGLYFRVGARVVIRPQGLEGLTGVVRWVEGDYAGVEFDREIYQPVVDHLVRLHGVTTVVPG